jgi:hypothetical protein
MNHIKLFESFDMTISPEEFQAEMDKAIAMDNHLDAQAHIRKTISDNPEIKTNPKLMEIMKKVAAWADSLTPEQQDEMRAAAGVDRGGNDMVNPVPAPQNKYQPMGNQSDLAVSSLSISPGELETEIDKAISMGSRSAGSMHIRRILSDNPGIRSSKSHLQKLGKFASWMLGGK